MKNPSSILIIFCFLTMGYSLSSPEFSLGEESGPSSGTPLTMAGVAEISMDAGLGPKLGKSGRSECLYLVGSYKSKICSGG